MRRRLVFIIAGILALGLGIGLTAATVSDTTAHAATLKSATYPTPSVTPAPTQPIVTPTPTPTVTPPVVNPFARCSFTFTNAFTFVPRLHRFVERVVPAIACLGPFGRVSVYDLVRG